MNYVTNVKVRLHRTRWVAVPRSVVRHIVPFSPQHSAIRRKHLLTSHALRYRGRRDATHGVNDHLYAIRHADKNSRLIY